MAVPVRKKRQFATLYQRHVELLHHIHATEVSLASDRLEAQRLRSILLKMQARNDKRTLCGQEPLSAKNVR